MARSKHDAWTVTELGCPDCAGVLRTRQDGENEHQEYQCHVGHRFSALSLLKGKETQLECALWSALVLLAHVEMACNDLIGRDGDGARSTRAVIRRRIREVQDQQRKVRAIIEGTHVCQLGEP